MSFPPPARSLFFSIVAVVTALAAVADVASAASRDLQANGSDKRMWLARVEPSPLKQSEEITTLFVREKSSNEWRRIAPVGSRVVGLGSRGAQLAILLPGGSWRLTTDDGLASGRPLPFGAKIVALGGDGNTLWAVGETPRVDVEATGGARASTGPTTNVATPRSPATRPATTTTAPSAPTLRLYRLGPQAWEDVGPLPDGIVPGEGLTLSLGAAGSAGTPLLAHQAGTRQIRLYRSKTGGTWELVGQVESPVDLTAFQLLGGTADPVLWFRGATGPGRVWIDQAGDGIVRELKDVPAGADHAVAFANGAIRVLWLDNDKIVDQRLNPATGEPEGDRTPLPLPAVSLQPKVMFWAQLTLTTAVVFALAASLRRRREMQDEEIDPARFALAPFTMRFVAGAIDAIPLLVSSWMVRSRTPANADLQTWVIVLAGFATYILLTALCELIAGRSIGKMFTGLQVVGLDGKRPGVAALIMRNLLRVIDLAAFGMPLALVFFSPLRQRAADFAAGTVVVLRSKPEDKSDAEPDKKDDASS